MRTERKKYRVKNRVWFYNRTDFNKTKLVGMRWNPDCSYREETERSIQRAEEKNDGNVNFPLVFP